MRIRTVGLFMLALATLSSCRAVQRTFGLSNGGTGSTSIYGHWVLATPVDSTGFTGASQVELVLAPGSFKLSAAYPNRAPLAVGGTAQVDNGRLTLVPAGGGATDGASIGFAPGQPFTRLATASGATLLLAPPTSRVPVASSVWHRIDAARIAGLAR